MLSVITSIFTLLLLALESGDWWLFYIDIMQGNQANRSVLLNSKVIDYVNFILRASEFPTCSAEKVWVNLTCLVWQMWLK